MPRACAGRGWASRARRLRSGEHVAPQEFTLGEGIVELGKQFLRDCGGESGDEA